MVKHNHIISNGHFHKNWQKYVKTWFDQPFRKKRKAQKRLEKARRLAPRPTSRLRPVVSCPSFRYNHKYKLGRGFSLVELKKAGLCPKYARSVGISVDPRRTNKSYEALGRNVQRLKEYNQRLVVYPRRTKRASQGERKIERDENETEKIYKTVEGIVMNLKKGREEKIRLKSMKITAEDKKFSAYLTLKKEKGRAKRKKRHRKKKVEVPTQ